MTLRNKPVPEILKEIGEVLDRSWAVYDVMTALRGPDLRDDVGYALEFTFTMNIRAGLVRRFRHEEWPKASVMLSDIVVLATGDVIDHRHVVIHMRDALGALSAFHWDKEVREYYTWLTKLLEALHKIWSGDKDIEDGWEEEGVMYIEKGMDMLVNVVEEGFEKGYVYER